MANRKYSGKFRKKAITLEKTQRARGRTARKSITPLSRKRSRSADRCFRAAKLSGDIVLENALEDMSDVEKSEVEPGNYISVLKTQELYGNWKWNKDTFRVLEIEEDEANNKMPKKLKDIIKDKETLLEVWITILALAKLEADYSNDQQAWQMIFKKAVQWLRKQGVDYNAFKSSATKLI